MLTVKHVGDTGNETIYPATEVSYNPSIGSGSVGGPTSVKQPSSIGCVWYTVPGSGEIKSLEGGTVYVMNEAGKTVSTYRMSQTDYQGTMQFAPFDAGKFGSDTTARPSPAHFLKPDGRIG